MEPTYRPNGYSADRELGELKAEMRHVKDLQQEQSSWMRRELDALWQDLEAEAKERKSITRSINRGILYVAGAAVAIIFELLRKGVVF